VRGVTLCIIQARLGSTRLPRKALMDIGGRSMIQRVVAQVRQIRGVDEVVLAVPHGEVVALCYCANVYGPKVPESDVLARFAATAERYPDADTIMRVTGDCPLLDPRVCEQVLALYRSDPHVEYVWNRDPSGPCSADGEDCEVFSAAALRWAHREARDPYDREHVSSWIRRNVKTATWRPSVDRGHVKISVDTQEDLERVRQMVQGC
jgi:spore coat polysaccharide biosynthesis protein SpsF